MATCAVSGTIQDSSGTAIQGAVVRFNEVQPQFSTTIFVAPKEISTTTDSSGNWTLNIIQTLSGMIYIDYPPNTTDSNRRVVYSVVIPNASTANFSTLATEL